MLPRSAGQCTAGGSPTLTGFIPRVSARALKLLSSPLRLPISPSRPGAHGSASFFHALSLAPTKTPCWQGVRRDDQQGNDGGAGRSRTALDGFAIRCITALLPRRVDCCAWKRLRPILTKNASARLCCLDLRLRSRTGTRCSGVNKKGSQSFPFECGAGDETRTRDLNLGKVALYQLSYSRLGVLETLSFTSTTETTPGLRDSRRCRLSRAAKCSRRGRGRASATGLALSASSAL